MPVFILFFIFFLSMSSLAKINIHGLSLRIAAPNYQNSASNKVLKLSDARLKLFLGYILLQEISENHLDGQKNLILYPKHKMGGHGNLQYQLSGAQVPILKIAEIAIQENDDTAANMLLDELGDCKELNLKLMQNGFENTQINDYFPSSSQTSSQDLAKLILVSKKLKKEQAQIFKKWLNNCELKT